MCSALVSVNRLKNELNSYVARLFWDIHVFLVCFGSAIKEQGILMCSALVLVHGFKNNFDLCVACSFRIMD